MRRDEPEVVNDRVEEDPVMIEAITNIQMAIGKIARIWEVTRSHDLAEAQADLEQALRFLTRPEEPE